MTNENKDTTKVKLDESVDFLQNIDEGLCTGVKTAQGELHHQSPL